MDWLKDALQTVCEQSLPSQEYEVIVVDNNSTDQTSTVAQDFAARYSNVRYCFEPKAGLSIARNTGWQEANGAYVAYIDDDCKVPFEWLSIAKEVIESIAPAMFGGPSLAFYNTTKPKWFQDHYESHTQNQETGLLKPNQYISGMNMIFDKEVLRDIGGFDPNLGMSADQVAYGEESAVLRYVRKEMPDALLYVDLRLYVYHLVRPEKMTWRWIIPNRFIRGRYAHRVYAKDRPSSAGRTMLIGKGIALMGMFCLDGIYGVLFRKRSQYPYVQNYLYESTLQYLTSLGYLYEQIYSMNRGVENK